MGASWDVLSEPCLVLARLGPSWRSSWRGLGKSRGVLAGSGGVLARLERALSRLSASWGGLEDVLGGFWGLDGSWGRLGGILARLGGCDVRWGGRVCSRGACAASFVLRTPFPVRFSNHGAVDSGRVPGGVDPPHLKGGTASEDPPWSQEIRGTSRLLSLVLSCLRTSWEGLGASWSV